MLAVGGLSLLTGGLFLWAAYGLHATVVPGTLAGFTVFVIVNIATAGLLWWHRQYPVRVFAAILAVTLISAVATGTLGNGGLTLPLWFSVFALTAYAPQPKAWSAIAAGWLLGTAVKVYLAAAAGYALTVPEIGLLFVGDVGFFYVSCGVLGFGFRFQRQRAQEAAEHARLVHSHARAIQAEAVATERNRLARDLHDLAAHELMDVLLSVRALQITSDDPTLPEIELKTARALDNMRTVVRTLRKDDDHTDPDRRTLQDAASEIIDTLRADRGIEVAATIRIDVPVDDATASTVLSVLTEVLLNAARHAPGQPVTVALDSSRSGTTLTATNPVGPAATAGQGTGYGLIGAAERARLIGGSFSAARDADEDWTATLHLPPIHAPAGPSQVDPSSAHADPSPVQEVRS